MLSFPDWLEQSALLLGAVFCIGFWYAAQKDRVHTAAYRLTFGIAALTAAACILFCGGVPRIVGWCLYLLLLTGFGRRAKFSLCHAVFLWAVFAGFMDPAAVCAEWLVFGRTL